MTTEEAMKQVEAGLEALSESLKAGKSETLQKFIETMARFHKYSFQNALLIFAQMQDATHVAGFGTWKKLDRFVKKGERGIAIIAPMVARKNSEGEPGESSGENKKYIHGFRVAYVFDVSQTEGAVLPEFGSVVGEPGEWLSHLEGLTRELRIVLQYCSIPGGSYGVSLGGMIRVRDSLHPNETFAVLAHELAHELLHKDIERRQTTTVQVRETEAEAVAYAVCRACAMDTTSRSADYIQLWQGSPEMLHRSLVAVRDTAAFIIGKLYQRSEQRSSKLVA